MLLEAERQIPMMGGVEHKRWKFRYMFNSGMCGYNDCKKQKQVIRLSYFSHTILRYLAQIKNKICFRFSQQSQTNTNLYRRQLFLPGQVYCLFRRQLVVPAMFYMDKLASICMFSSVLIWCIVNLVRFPIHHN